MTRINILFAALLAMSQEVAAQQLTVASVEALPGETVEVTLSLNTDGGNYTGMEFDILFPEPGFVTTGVATTLAAWDGSFTIGDVGGVDIDNLARCGVLSYSNTAIPGEGLQLLGTVQVRVGTSLALGDYTLTLCNITLIGEQRVSVVDATATLSVVSAHNVELREDAQMLPQAAEGVNVTLLRTIKGGEWNTICLPFDVSGQQLTEAYGSELRLAEFSDWHSQSDNNGNITGIEVSFTEVSATRGIQANVPMLIRIGETVSSAVFESVDIAPAENPHVQVGSTAKTRGVFYGTYVAQKVPEENLFIAGNNFYYSTGATTIKAFRGFFELHDVLDAYYNADASSHVKLLVDGIATHVSDDLDIQPETAVYDLCGRRISQPRQRGIYVVDGKKKLINSSTQTQ